MDIYKYSNKKQIEIKKLIDTTFLLIDKAYNINSNLDSFVIDENTASTLLSFNMKVIYILKQLCLANENMEYLEEEHLVEINEEFQLFIKRIDNFEIYDYEFQSKPNNKMGRKIEF